jgi:pyruvate kinase
MSIDTRPFVSSDSANAAKFTQRARKRTKIVATLGPACSSEPVMRELFKAGINVARFNMSHGDHSDHLARLEMIRRISKELERPVAVLADLQGPKIRTGKLKDNKPVQWRVGDKVVITVAPCPEGTAQRVGTTYEGLARDVVKGNVLLIDDGLMRAEVDHVDGDDIHCVVLVGGTLKSNKGINLPGVSVSTPSVSDKDKADLAWAIANDVDYIALSFVRSARDVRNLKSRIAESGREIPVIAKIEKGEAVEAIEEILHEADGIMVARGDLGIEISTQRLPIVQKDLITKANRHGKLVITATQMLESMIENPIPTRAESSDVANAIFDGSDAVMLSGETASGKFPVEAVAEMTRIAAEAEKSPYMQPIKLDRSHAPFNNQALAFTGAADYLSRELNADGIMVLGHGFEKALLLSKRRGNVPLVAICHDERTWRRMSLFWGIIPIYFPAMDHLQDLVEKATDECLRYKVFEEGNTIVVISGASIAAGTNTIKVYQI